jgi:class 3 adenylate cyclase
MGLLRTIVFGSSPPWREGWRSLRDGMTTDFAFLQADVAGHSRISRSNPTSTVEDVLESLEAHVDAICSNYDGRIWNWAGDGGLIAFHEGSRTQKVVAAVSAAMELLQSLPDFNIKHPLEVVGDQIRLRVAVHCGTAHYRTNTDT